MSLIARDDLVGLVNLGYELVSSGQVAAGRKIFSNLVEVYPDNQTIMVGLAFSHIVVDEFAKGEAILAPFLAQDDVFDETLAIAVLSKFLQKDLDGAKALASQIKDLESPAAVLAKNILETAAQ